MPKFKVGMRVVMEGVVTRISDDGEWVTVQLDATGQRETFRAETESVYEIRKKERG